MLLLQATDSKWYTTYLVAMTMSVRGKIRVQDGETGTRLSEWSRELIPDEVRHNEKTD